MTQKFSRVMLRPLGPTLGIRQWISLVWSVPFSNAISKVLTVQAAILAQPIYKIALVSTTFMIQGTFLHPVTTDVPIVPTFYSPKLVFYFIPRTLVATALLFLAHIPP